MVDQTIRTAQFFIICHSWLVRPGSHITDLAERIRRVKDTDDKILPIFLSVRGSAQVVSAD